MVTSTREMKEERNHADEQRRKSSIPRTSRVEEEDHRRDGKASGTHLTY